MSVTYRIVYKDGEGHEILWDRVFTDVHRAWDTCEKDFRGAGHTAHVIIDPGRIPPIVCKFCYHQGNGLLMESDFCSKACEEDFSLMMKGELPRNIQSCCRRLYAFWRKDGDALRSQADP